MSETESERSDARWPPQPRVFHLSPGLVERRLLTHNAFFIIIFLINRRTRRERERTAGELPAPRQLYLVSTDPL